MKARLLAPASVSIVSVSGYCLYFGTSSGSASLYPILVASSVSYLWLINDRAIMGYETSSLEKKVSVLKDNNQRLDLELIELQEIGQIKEKAENLQMALVEEVEYLNVGSDGLARR